MSIRNGWIFYHVRLSKAFHPVKYPNIRVISTVTTIRYLTWFKSPCVQPYIQIKI